MDTLREKLEQLVAGYLSEFGCPLFYAHEIVDGILDTFEITFKRPLEAIPDRDRPTATPLRVNRGAIVHHRTSRARAIKSVPSSH